MHAAVPAKKVVVAPRVELIIGQGIAASEQPERGRRDNRGPEAQLGAYRAVAAQGALRQVDVGRETYRAAVTTTVINFHDFSLRVTDFSGNLLRTYI